MQTKGSRDYLTVFGTGKYPPSSGKFSRSWSKSRCALGGLAYCFSLKVKWGFIPAQELESERSKSFLCLFHCKPKPSGASLERPGLENIPQLPGNRAEVGQNLDLRKVVSATHSVLKWSGAIFQARSPKVSVQKVLLCSFHCKPRPSRVSLASPWQENMPQGSGNWAEVVQNHDGPKVVSATLSVLKSSGPIFRARSPKVSVKKVFLCPFHCKPRPSGVSLESPGLKNIAQVPGNRTEVHQNHDAWNAVSATVSVLN